MENDIQSPQRRTPFLLRQVVVPNWVQVILMGAFVWAVIKMFFTSPLMLVAAFIVGLVYFHYVRRSLRRSFQQSTETDKAEVDTAPTSEYAIVIKWRQARTYQVWTLAIMILVVVLFLLDVAGVPTP